jgi:tetratricopeptide (TPR) repeat protein
MLLIGCGSSRKNGAGEQEMAPPPRGEASQSAYQIELKRNWSFGFENYKNRRYQDVPHFFWRVVEMDTARAFIDVYSFLANAYLELGKPDSALLVYEHGIRTLPDNSNLYRGMADLLASQDRKAEAIAHYQKLAEMNTAEENDFRKLGELSFAVADTIHAIEALEKVQALAPEDLEIRRRLSMLYPSGNHRASEDVQLLKLRLQQNPNDPPTLLALGKAYYYRLDYAASADMLRLYVEMMPDDSYAREYLGGACLALHRFHEAMNQFNIILGGNPEHPEALIMLARCHAGLKEWAAARRYAHRALAVDDKNGLTYIVLGEIYEQAARDCQAAGDFSKKLVFRLAYEQYEKALQDSIAQNEANRRMKALEPMLPSSKDYFMNKNQDRPDGECYSWIYK